MNKSNSLNNIVKSYINNNNNNNNNGLINNNSSVNQNTNKRTLIDSSQHHAPMAASESSSLSPHSPSTSSSSNSSARHQSNLNTSSSSSSSINLNNNNTNNDLITNTIPSMPIFNDMSLRLNLITHLLRYNDLELNCVQFVNLIDLYFEDDVNNNNNTINGYNEQMHISSTRRSNDSMSFLNDLKQINGSTQNNNNELKLASDSSTATTTCFPCIVCSNRFLFLFLF